MNSIQNIFLTKTIPDLKNPEFNMGYIKFVFDKETLNNLINHLDKEDLQLYYEGLKSIEYLYKTRNEMIEGKDKVFIQVHDSEKFFSLLQELIDTYKKGSNHTLLDYDNFIRSIWLRMGVNDINDVEGFLKKQLVFLKNDEILGGNYPTICELNDEEYLVYHVKNNKDWFETNQNIDFEIIKKTDDLFESIKYMFPSIQFGLAKENNCAKCYIYGIQSIGESRSNEIKEKLQPIRSSLRNKSISADFIIGMSLFLDFLYDQSVRTIEIPTLQVFNYPYHEQISENTKKKIEKAKEKQLNDNDYRCLKNVEKKFVDKENLISYNKTERFIELFNILMEMNPNIELVSEPLVNGENMIIHLNGKTDILKDYSKNERTKS